MPPPIALFLWLILLLALLCFDPAKVRGTSAALWIPIIWMFIAGSRLPSQWFGAVTGQMWVANLEDGNPLDRTIDLVLMGTAVAILFRRSFGWRSFFARNFALILFIAFTLMSAFWSDFPLVAAKRWFRDLGNYLMVLVVLSDPLPLDAATAVFRRLGYFLVPLSILLDKYFPTISKSYDAWTGVGSYVGVATGKNLLGLVALLSGVFFFWDTIVRWSDKNDRRTKRIILVNLSFLAMSISLLFTANSATCKICMFIGCLVIFAVQGRWGQRHQRFLKFLIPTSFLVYLVLSLGFGMSGQMAAAVGKDPTLTDRTKIWSFVLGMHTNPWIGTGYESFWMGPRLLLFWNQAGLGHINEAHNGYLEVYLNLGVIGLILISAILITRYRTICKRLAPLSSFASLGFALWTIMLFYCVTEAGFRSGQGLIWIVFLLVTVSVKLEDRLPATVPAVIFGPVQNLRVQPASAGQLQPTGDNGARQALPGFATSRQSALSKNKL
jgi:exopolysaccharide production protein ExoQ